MVKKLREISTATIDRLLKTTKAKMKIQGTNGTKPAKGIQKRVASSRDKMLMEEGWTLKQKQQKSMARYR